MKKLAVSISSFEDLITGNCIYVDKTAVLHALAQYKGFYFLSRPRRFGKSLTCSTLEAIFQGKKELFDGLAISRMEYDWKKYPVIHISFAEVSHKTDMELIDNVKVTLHNCAQKYGVSIDQSIAPGTYLAQLIIKLHEKHGPVVVIIDEYDKPILDHIDDKAMVEKMQQLMRSLYGVFKGNNVGSCMRFLFITGVSRFSKVSLFSELNNLKDLSMNEDVATMCGYTQQELEENFKEHINALAQAKGWTYQQALAELKRWYNGFKFSNQGEKVYNPFSIAYCLDDKKIENYWFSSGTPKFMLTALTDAPEEKRNELKEQLLTLELQKISSSSIQNFNIARLYDNLLVLFLQTGYLTIKEYDDFASMYWLHYPNEEVRRSCTEQIMLELVQVSLDAFADWIAKFRRALLAGDLDTFLMHMQNFMRLIPHNVIVNREKCYQATFFTICKLLGVHMFVEEATDLGFIDGVITTPTNVFVIEFKKDRNPAAALAQIKKNNYSYKYVVEGNLPVMHVGISFYFTKGKSVTLKWLTEQAE